MRGEDRVPVPGVDHLPFASVSRRMHGFMDHGCSRFETSAECGRALQCGAAYRDLEGEAITWATCVWRTKNQVCQVSLKIR